MNSDQRYMWRCLELAKRGAGLVAPNPMVGAVLVHNDRILAEGWHKNFGEAHAEANCIKDADEKGLSRAIASSTMYVNLEPCAHYGKTPPCADLLIRYRIPKVVISSRDPFEAVNGKGIDKLKSAGVEVVCDVLEKDARELNKRFFTFHEKKRPYIILKWAQTKDGLIGSRRERLIVTNGFSERMVHQWRAEESAILIGANTASLDDPLLTNRHWAGHSPIRILLDPQLRVDTKLRIFNGESPLIVFNKKKHSFEAGQEKTLSAVNYFKTDSDSVKEICDALYQLKIQSLIVEGGATVLQSFIDSGTWDEVRLTTSSRSTGKLSEPVPAPQLSVHHKTGEQEIESDFLEYFHNPA